LLTPACTSASTNMRAHAQIAAVRQAIQEAKGEGYAADTLKIIFQGTTPEADVELSLPIPSALPSRFRLSQAKCWRTRKRWPAATSRRLTSSL
jgi:hypothetical protein